jgi:hypothetical protein
MKKLFKFYWDCGRMGILDGLFIATQEQVDDIIGKNVYFGEVLGKHSEIEGIVEKDEIKLISDNFKLVTKLEKIFDSETLCGYNPVHIYKELLEDGFYDDDKEEENIEEE